MTIALIDGDLIAYRCAASAENEEVSEAYKRASDLLDNIIAKTGADAYQMFLTGGNSFRKAIYPEYKGNRSQPKPKWLQEVRDWLINECNAVVAKDGLEADDELTIAQTEDTIICSLDKDLLQIQGKHFSWQIEGGPPDKRWMKPDKFTTQTELEGLRVFYQQCLKGDSSDNIKGALGIGEKKAEQKLKDCTTEKEMIEVCLGEYFTEEEFLMNAQCLYLLRTYDDSYLTRFERVLNED